MADLTREDIEGRKRWWQSKLNTRSNILPEERNFWSSEVALCDLALSALRAEPGEPVALRAKLDDLRAAASATSAELAETKDKLEACERDRDGATRNHTCHWPGCAVQVPPAMWGCKAHWFRLHKDLRDAIWKAYRPGQEADGKPSARYLATALLVQEWIAGRIEIRADGSVHPVAKP